MKIFLPILLTLVLISCSTTHKDNTEAISEAETLVDTHDYSEALTICNNIIADTIDSQMSASQWGRLAIIYMQLAEVVTEDENTALALKCYRKAFAVDSDSAAIYFENIDIASHAHTLNMLSTSLDSPIDLVEYEPQDSIYI